MKKLTIIVAAASLSLSMAAHDSYYYHYGSKIPLMEDATKVVSISTKSEKESMPSDTGLTLVNTISSKRSNIRVYELASGISFGQAITAKVSSSSYMQPCYKSEDGSVLIPNGYINVKLIAAGDYPKLQSIAQRNGCEIIEQNEFMPLWYNLRVMEAAGRNSVDIANRIYETGYFASAFPSFSVDGREISYDPNVYEQWGLYNSTYDGIDISVSEAWNYATGRGVTVAIVDEGVDLNHQDLKGNIYAMSYDTETQTSPSKLYGEHGTHCAGIVAAVRNNGIQVAGVAPDAKLMSVSNSLTFSENYERNLANGINWAWNNGADVISCSWWCHKNPLIEEAINNAVRKGRNGKGCVFVKSAGNYTSIHPTYAISYPGDYSADVLAVSNMTKDGSISASSCYGPNLLVTAPGTDIISTVPNDCIATKSGTSMACPHVAGVAALILERNPKLSARQVREIIAKNTKKIGSLPYNINKTYGTWNEKYGYGLVDAYKAITNTPRP